MKVENLNLSECGTWVLIWLNDNQEEDFNALDVAEENGWEVLSPLEILSPGEGKVSEENKEDGDFKTSEATVEEGWEILCTGEDGFGLYYPETVQRLVSNHFAAPAREEEENDDEKAAIKKLAKSIASTQNTASRMS